VAHLDGLGGTPVAHHCARDRSVGFKVRPQGVIEASISFSYLMRSGAVFRKGRIFMEGTES
jgi:hypothetical protein